nr:hypothetical protein [Paraburkholderia guartelaensis]
MAEAIFLADRILVLKANPGEVQELIEVPVPRPRSYAQLTSPEFLATRARLDALIHPPTADEPEDARIHPNMIRLTDVIDSAEQRSVIELRPSSNCMPSARSIR